MYKSLAVAKRIQQAGLCPRDASRTPDDAFCDSSPLLPARRSSLHLDLSPRLAKHHLIPFFGMAWFMFLLALFLWPTQAQRRGSTFQLSFPSDLCSRDKASRVASLPPFAHARPLPTQRTKKQLLIQVPRPLASRLFALARPGLSFVRPQPCHLPRHGRGCSIIRSSPRFCLEAH